MEESSESLSGSCANRLNTTSPATSAARAKQSIVTTLCIRMNCRVLAQCQSGSTAGATVFRPFHVCGNHARAAKSRWSQVHVARATVAYRSAFVRFDAGYGNDHNSTRNEYRLSLLSSRRNASILCLLRGTLTASHIEEVTIAAVRYTVWPPAQRQLRTSLHVPAEAESAMQHG